MEEGRQLRSGLNVGRRVGWKAAEESWEYGYGFWPRTSSRVGSMISAECRLRLYSCSAESASAVPQTLFLSRASLTEIWTTLRDRRVSQAVGSLGNRRHKDDRF